MIAADVVRAALSSSHPGGKSAILTAITIALGGKATSTDRGKSLKSFVKEGKAYVSHRLRRSVPC